jgi:hypothetical protein
MPALFGKEMSEKKGLKNGPDVGIMYFKGIPV